MEDFCLTLPSSLHRIARMNIQRGTTLNNPGYYAVQRYDMQALQNSLMLMVEAVQGEQEDRLFYDYLISVAPTQEDKDIIASIRDDEIRHNLMFKQMYKMYTGQEVPDAPGEEFTKPSSYEEGITASIVRGTKGSGEVPSNSSRLT